MILQFWRVEIKSGIPYTHKNNETRVRLRIGQATLGSGPKMKQRVVVQCNIGNKSPVVLCALLPEISEWCSLNLEFEEEEDVVFSVLGPKSVHLTGYYLRPLINHDAEEIDSYGEGIGETDTDKSSDYDDTEDDYEDDFIADGDLKIFHASPKPNSVVEIEEIVDCEKSAYGNGTRRRLKKKYHINDSDNDDGSYHISYSVNDDGSHKEISIKSSNTLVLESEDEDDFPISSIFKKHDVKNVKAEEKLDKKVDVECMREKKEKDESHRVTCLKRKVVANDQDCDSGRGVGQQCDSSVPCSEVGAESEGMPKKRKKEEARQGQSTLE
ncbi:peptidyl-prolyl cis-trans isomerase FKBP53-like [Tasmannia lanceolata]|uniref:peptidyl-prolyl cis-trans isomerase FKBP53-like n=1 Tax=Tasmannia lanceolata TaxID=3420 RepID=UPI0040646A89